MKKETLKNLTHYFYQMGARDGVLTAIGGKLDFDKVFEDFINQHKDKLDE